MTSSQPPFPAVRNVLLVAKTGAREGADLVERLAAWLEARGVNVRFTRRTSEAIGRAGGVQRERIPDDTDLLMVAGGDGTLLALSRTAAPRGIPILGINLGSLGFLTELQPDEMFDDLERVLEGHYDVEERRTLRVRLFRDRAMLREDGALNDVVLGKSALSRMLNLEIRVDGERVASYFSDGLIISTPTGSTAYSLSAGGPVVDPRVRAFIVTPICPHTMAYRPLVIPDSVVVEARLRNETREDVYVTLDGQIGYPLEEGDAIRVDDELPPVRLVRITGRSFFEVLRRKLRWGVR